ncbi:MAG: hypothetical protein LBK67_11500 [Coriobacteriales bacterium]|jgi:hypothetical protein|nr:hypothetical protein [Coriobacteriales bacterium]
MKVLTVAGEELVDVTLKNNRKGSLTNTVNAPLMGVSVTSDMEISMERTRKGLIVHMRVPGKVKFDLLLEPSDVAGMKGLINKDLIMFFLGAMFKGR